LIQLLQLVDTLIEFRPILVGYHQVCTYQHAHYNHSARNLLGLISARLHMIYSSIMLSVLNDRPSVTRVDQSKMVEVMIMKFSPYGSL